MSEDLQLDHAKHQAMSVESLVRKRFDMQDPWKLALVQRHPVWDSIRIASLLDSLLAGYPIGTLLVCRLRKASKVLEKSGNTRVATDAAPGSWQLLDGQQRINALVTLFTSKGEYGRFYINMTMPRKKAIVATTKRDKKSLVEYIIWQDSFSHETVLDSALREKLLDLSRWYEWAEPQSRAEMTAHLEKIQEDDAHCIKVLNDIDPEFADSLSEDELKTAAQTAKRLLEIWLEESIPVQYLTLGDAEDVLQVFTRSNLEGMNVSGEEVFFAAVKTSWNDAEEYLDGVSGPLIDRITALRLLARTASWATREEDLLPLSVDSLNGEEGSQIIRAMRQMAAGTSRVNRRIKEFEKVLIHKSRIGNGLRYVNRLLLDDVFAWAIALPEPAYSELIPAQLPTIETYLLGAQTFGYPVIFRLSFSRMTFIEALSAGLEGAPFPMKQILGCSRNRWKKLRYGRRNVQPVNTEYDKLDYVDRNYSILLSILQSLPFMMPNRKPGDSESDLRVVEWDHIYPQLLARKMSTWSDETKRYHAHRDRGFVWGGGNLWALDKPLNNYARASWPSDKLKLLKDPQKVCPNLPSRWPEAEKAFLLDHEEKLLREAEESLREENVPKGMRAFKEFASGRGLRIFSEITERFPELGEFGETDETSDKEKGNIESDKLVKAIGIHMEMKEPLKEDQEVREKGEMETVYKLAEENGLQEEIRELVNTAERLGLCIRKWKTCVMIAPMADRRVALFTVWPGTPGEDDFSIQIFRKSIRKYYPNIPKDDIDNLGENEFGTSRPGSISSLTRKLERLFEKTK